MSVVLQTKPYSNHAPPLPPPHSLDRSLGLRTACSPRECHSGPPVSPVCCFQTKKCGPPATRQRLPQTLDTTTTTTPHPPHARTSPSLPLTGVHLARFGSLLRPRFCLYSRTRLPPSPSPPPPQDTPPHGPLFLLLPTHRAPAPPQSFSPVISVLSVRLAYCSRPSPSPLAARRASTHPQRLPPSPPCT